MSFAEKVYDAVRRIPKGRVATYGQIAEIIGCPGGSRAVGNALHVNPFAPIDNPRPKPSTNNGLTVPCHRVVAADGSLAANFAFGGPAGQYERLAAEGIPFLDTRESLAYCPKVDRAKCGIIIERHPLEPFLPSNGRILFLGSFPPPKARWSMEFFYPNWINDFWRIQGLIHFGDAHHFEAKGEKRFDRSAIIDFCRQEGLAFYDTASKVCRWKGNASDEFLEILEQADIPGMLTQMSDCQTIVTTGGKSAEELLDILQRSAVRNAGATPEGPDSIPAAVPAVGGFFDIKIHYRKANETTGSKTGNSCETTTTNPNADGGTARTIRWWRMPSTSRAYPMALEAKAAQYKKLLWG